MMFERGIYKCCIKNSEKADVTLVLYLAVKSESIASEPQKLFLSTYHILLTPTIIYFYIYKNENMIRANYLHLASVCKKHNILTLAFSEGFPGVWHAMTTDENGFSVPQDPSYEFGLPSGGWILDSFWVQHWNGTQFKWWLQPPSRWNVCLRKTNLWNPRIKLWKAVKSSTTYNAPNRCKCGEKNIWDFICTSNVQYNKLIPNYKTVCKRE